MASFQYRNSSSTWTDVPTYAFHGTLAGDFALHYPAPTDYDGTGRRAGAVGRPTLRLQSQVMTACGLAFWQELISAGEAPTSEDALIFITAKNPRTNAWERYTGYLERPTWGRVQQGSGSGNTLYYDVVVTINEIAVTVL